MTGGILFSIFINELHAYKTRAVSFQDNFLIIYHRDVYLVWSFPFYLIVVTVGLDINLNKLHKMLVWLRLIYGI
jgi:hypothetical protein